MPEIYVWKNKQPSYISLSMKCHNEKGCEMAYHCVSDPLGLSSGNIVFKPLCKHRFLLDG